MSQRRRFALFLCTDKDRTLKLQPYRSVVCGSERAWVCPWYVTMMYQHKTRTHSSSLPSKRITIVMDVERPKPHTKFPMERELNIRQTQRNEKGNELCWLRIFIVVLWTASEGFLLRLHCYNNQRVHLYLYSLFQAWSIGHCVYGSFYSSTIYL